MRIASVPNSATATHNRTSCNSPEYIFPNSEYIRKIRENLHLGKITRYTVGIAIAIIIRHQLYIIIATSYVATNYSLTHFNKSW